MVKIIDSLISYICVYNESYVEKSIKKQRKRTRKGETEMIYNTDESKKHVTRLCDEELRNEINNISNTYFEKPFVHHARYNNRLRTTGGRYIPGKQMIEVNPKYVHEMPYNEVIGIIKHELCHYHLHMEGKPFGHGDRAFKQLLKKTNSPRFCKPLPSTMKNKVIHSYVCKTCKTMYHRKRKVNVNKVRCGKCSDKIVFKETIKRY